MKRKKKAQRRLLNENDFPLFDWQEEDFDYEPATALANDEDDEWIDDREAELDLQQLREDLLRRSMQRKRMRDLDIKRGLWGSTSA